jgi:predicted transcriptional regulator with HTH domain
MDGMQEENQIECSIDIKRPLVIRALRRSNVRKKIAEYLFEISPSSSYTSEIAYNIKTTPTNVIGAIRGMGSRYKTEESLLGLNIIEEKNEGKNIKLYGLTSFGKEVISSIIKDF